MTLTADTSEISDADGLNNVSYSYQWIRSDNGTDTDITGETDSTYTPVTADVGKAIKIRVSFTDDRNNAETLTSQATAAVVATVPTQPLSLTVARGDQIQELDASWQAPSSNGGSAITGYKVQWKETADSWDTAADVSEATVTGTTYTITGLTGGVEYTVRVIATNVVGDGPASVEATGTPAGGTSQQNAEPENNDPTGAPTISGTEQVDQTLTADTADISDDDGLTSVSYSYQWIRTDNGTDTDIAGATDSTYTLVFADQGKTIKVRVSFTDEAGNEETLTSNPTTAVTAAPNRQARGAPTINGTVQVDQTLTADTSEITDDDGLTNVSYSYQWMADDVNIRDATGSTYTLADNDEGKAIKVKVSFTDDRNNAEARTSQATAAVAAAPNRQATGEPTDAPTVASMTITSSPNDDAVTEMDGERTKVGDWRVYGIDDSVEVTVTFSAGVTVTGKPQLELDVGGSAKAAEYKDSDGSNVKFSYTVAENDEDTDGVSIGANKLRLNGGTIRGDADQDADLSHDALSAQKKHKVDGIRPSFKTIRFSASNTYNLNGYYEEGEEVFIKVQFSEGSIYVSGTPQLTIDVGGKEREATFERTSFGDLFVYTVQEGDLDLDGPSFSANSISKNGGYIRDGAGNDVKLSHSGASANQNSKVDAVAPTVSAVAITSDPGADDTYAAGDMVEVSVTFSEEVWVPGVTRSDLPGARHPVLDLRIGNNTRSAESGLQEIGRVVTFTYTIQSGDTDTDGISINANGLRLNGGVIFDDAGNNPISATIHNFFDIPLDAVVPHDAVADDPGHKVATNNNPAASAPTIGGTPQVDQTLTADTSNIADDDGLDDVSYSYQWIRSENGTDTDIKDATSSTYTLVFADQGKTIKVKVTLPTTGTTPRCGSATLQWRWPRQPTVRPRGSPPSGGRPRSTRP